jgi:PiT family inorganic phosphate transporter
MTLVIVFLAAAVAAVNGANDVPKGVVTLAGAGVTCYRTAILWGTLTTFVGSVASITLAERLTKLFTSGIVDLEPTKVFSAAVLLGVAAWVAAATVFRLPVSTTHAIVGALIGAGVVAGSEAVQWGSVTSRVALPLLLSIGVAFGISTFINARIRSAPECVCVKPVSALGFVGTVPLQITTGTVTDCRIHRKGTNTLHALHWASAGAASFARGLNDTPKIVAIAAFTLVPAGWSASSLALLVGTAMAAGSLIAGRRIAHRLAEDVVHMDHSEGLRANLTLSVLVGLGANRGLPMSTTHVATGAIGGTCGGRLSRLNRTTLRDFVLAWTATAPFAAVIAAVSLLALR